MKTKGFTLVELLVVIAILAILATVSVVGYTQYINNANAITLTTDAENIESVIEADLILGEQTVVLGKDASNNEIKVVREAGKPVIYVGANKADATGTAVKTFTHAQLTQFNTKTEYTITVKADGVITVTSNKVNAGDNNANVVTITLD